MQKVYIELVFADNFIIDMLILLTASLFTKSKKRWGRLAASASLGAVYACAVFGTSGFMSMLPIKVVVSALMCFIAFYARGERGFLKNACAFYVTSFMFAGAIYAVSFCFGGPEISRGSLALRPQATYVVMGLGAGAALAAVFSGVRRRTMQRERGTVSVELRYGERYTEAKAFIDTGNMLTEPLGGLPVAFITAAAAGRLFDKATMDIMNCRSEAVTDRLRVIPCATATGTGIFYGIEIDSVSLKGRSEKVRAVVCMAKGALAYGCDAVIGSPIVGELTKGEGYGKVSGTEDSGVDTGAAGACGERGLYQRQRGAASAADAAGGGDAADASGQGRQVGEARAH